MRELENALHTGYTHGDPDQEIDRVRAMVARLSVRQVCRQNLLHAYDLTQFSQSTDFNNNTLKGLRKHGQHHKCKVKHSSSQWIATYLIYFKD